MYADCVTKILTDVTTPQKIVRKVLRENNMEIVKKFSPIKSEYNFQLPGNKRISMTLTEDEFYRKEEQLRNNKWETTQEMHIWNDYGILEDAFIKSVSEIVSPNAGFKNL